MSAFAGSAQHYPRYRPGIPKDVAEIRDAAVPRRQPRRLLDIGTGTGLVVEALLARFDEIIAIDTYGEMLAAAESAMRSTVPTGVDAHEIPPASAHGIPPGDDERRPAARATNQAQA